MNRDTLGEEPLIEDGAVDADETAEFDVREVTTSDERAEMTLGHSGVGREGLEIEPLGPLRLRAN